MPNLLIKYPSADTLVFPLLLVILSIILNNTYFPSRLSKARTSPKQHPKNVRKPTTQRTGARLLAPKPRDKQPIHQPVPTPYDQQQLTHTIRILVDAINELCNHVIVLNRAQEQALHAQRTQSTYTGYGYPSAMPLYRAAPAPYDRGMGGWPVRPTRRAVPRGRGMEEGGHEPLSRRDRELSAGGGGGGFDRATARREAVFPGAEGARWRDDGEFDSEIEIDEPDVAEVREPAGGGFERWGYEGDENDGQHGNGRYRMNEYRNGEHEDGLYRNSEREAGGDKDAEPDRLGAVVNV